MKIQNLLLPMAGICMEEELFFRRDKGREHEVVLNAIDDSLVFAYDSRISFDTYFNGISIEKWKKYTNIQEAALILRLKGTFEVSLENLEYINGEIVRTIIHRGYFSCGKEEEFRFPLHICEYRGILSFSLRAQEDGSVFYGGWYDAEIDKACLKETNIAVDICTFRREPFIKRNIEILRKYILDDRSNELADHLRIYISDNGHTLPLEELNDEKIRVVHNKNVGGAGGFTRGMIEVMHHYDEFPASHILLMDDDIIILPESLYRTYMLLRCRRDEFEDVFIGGAMLRLDQQTIQAEAGALWNTGEFVSNKKGLDLSKLEDCLHNEIEEHVDYNAWWYCCIPMSCITPDNLPLPIFIRGDDIEYGLRNMRHLLLLNGICVWHEPFENKHSSFLSYYLIRNMMYDNALHCPELKVGKLNRVLTKYVMWELMKYRYKNVDLFFRAVDDFYKGVDFLKKTDGEALHKDVMAAGYKMIAVDTTIKPTSLAFDDTTNSDNTENRLQKLLRWITLNGYFFFPKKRDSIKVVLLANSKSKEFYREKEVLQYDPFSERGFVTKRDTKRLIRYSFRLLKERMKARTKYSDTAEEFRKRSPELTNEEFWSHYLELKQ